MTGAPSRASPSHFVVLYHHDCPLVRIGSRDVQRSPKQEAVPGSGLTPLLTNTVLTAYYTRLINPRLRKFHSSDNPVIPGSIKPQFCAPLLLLVSIRPWSSLPL